MKHYKKALDLEPDNSVFLYSAGVLSNIENNHAEAIGTLEKSIEKNKENIYAYLALGDAYEKKHEFAKAATVYKEMNSLGVNVQGLDEKLAQLEKLADKDE